MVSYIWVDHAVKNSFAGKEYNIQHTDKIYNTIYNKYHIYVFTGTQNKGSSQHMIHLSGNLKLFVQNRGYWIKLLTIKPLTKLNCPQKDQIKLFIYKLDYHYTKLK